MVDLKQVFTRSAVADAMGIVSIQFEQTKGDQQLQECSLHFQQTLALAGAFDTTATSWQFYCATL